MECINIALAKGRIADKTFELLKNMGIEFENYKISRKLILENKQEGINIIMVKADDVAVYVEHGAADIGIAGKDSIMESNADIYEIMDLGFGRCKFAVAALDGFNPVQGRKIRVATKYPRTAKEYFNSKMMPAEVIKLNGSVELAPIMGLSDVIVDIVETGKTLKENGLIVLEDICSISTRLVANKAGFKTKSGRILEIAEGIGRQHDESYKNK